MALRLKGRHAPRLRCDDNGANPQFERSRDILKAMSAALEGHKRIDQRSLALHRAIADKVRANPALLEIARENLDRWSRINSRSQPYWDAWREIFNRPLADLLQLLVEDSERMTALRQASPFAGVLEPAERWEIYARFEPKGARTA